MLLTIHNIRTHDIQCIPANTEREGNVIHKPIHVLLIAKEIRALVVNISAEVQNKGCGKMEICPVNAEKYKGDIGPLRSNIARDKRLMAHMEDLKETR